MAILLIMSSYLVDLSIVVPLHNEEPNTNYLFERLVLVLSHLDLRADL